MARDDEQIEEPDDDEIEDDDEVEDLIGARGGLGFLAGVVLGVLLGAGTALLLAPESGDVVRGRISRRVRRLRRDAEERMDDLRDDAEHGLRRARRKLRRPRRD
jgi:hypothetical protein